MASVRELEDSKAPAIFGQRSAILPNGKVSLSSALWYDIFFQLPKFKISPFLGTFIDQRKKTGLNDQGMIKEPGEFSNLVQMWD